MYVQKIAPTIRISPASHQLNKLQPSLNRKINKSKCRRKSSATTGSRSNPTTVSDQLSFCSSVLSAC